MFLRILGEYYPGMCSAMMTFLVSCIVVVHLPDLLQETSLDLWAMHVQTEEDLTLYCTISTFNNLEKEAF